MNQKLVKKKFSDIEKSYDVFLLDLYGVTHNGIKLFPGVLEVLKKLKLSNKIVVFISNAPRRSMEIKKVLKNFGVDESLYNQVISSGDVVYEYFLKRNHHQKCYYIGTEKDKKIFQGLKLIENDSLNNSNFILNTGAYENEKVSDYEETLRKAKSISIKMICANPDLEVIRGKKREICAGSLAQRYEELGGKVKYFGKPYKEIYEKSLKLLKIKKNNKILALGDSLRTDIAGANNFGIDSALVLSGINKNIKEIENFCKKTNIYPEFLLNNLKW